MHHDLQKFILQPAYGVRLADVPYRAFHHWFLDPI
jgi:hypothetical protein